MIGKTVDELSSRVKELEQHIARVDEAIKTLADELWNKEGQKEENRGDIFGCHTCYPFDI